MIAFKIDDLDQLAPTLKKAIETQTDRTDPNQEFVLLSAAEYALMRSSRRVYRIEDMPEDLAAELVEGIERTLAEPYEV